MPYCDKKAISFLLTTQCNLRCTYCYGARNTDKNVLVGRFAKRVLHDYVGGVGGIKQIRFFADGEPTTEMDLLKRIYEEAKGLEPNMVAEIQTNGVFSEETADWLGKNLDYVYVSIDLLPDDHDKYRVTAGGKPSSPLILKTLQYFKDMSDRKAKIALRATITKYNIERQKEGIDFYHDNYGIDIFWVDPIFQPVSDVAEKTYEPIDMMQFAETFVDAHNHAWSRDIFYESYLTTNFDGKTDKACRSCLPMPHLTMDGYLSACELATYGKDAGNMAPMIYARYDDENDKIVYDEEKLKTLRSRTLQNMPTNCRTCVAGEHCAGYCLGETLNENGSLFRVKTRVCKALRYIYGEIGYLYQDKFGTNGFPHTHP
jgi:radical SAM protein with 4Fe4S-binding SPASM domain